MPGTATTAAHMAGTRKMLETFSRSIMSSVSTGSKAPDRMITLVPPTSSGGRPPGQAGDVEQRRAGRGRPGPRGASRGA